MNSRRKVIFRSVFLGLLVALLVFASAAAQPGTDIKAGEQALSEVSIDVNPTDPDNLVIVGHSSSLLTMNTFYSTDGGLTWTFVSIGDADDGFTATKRFDPSVVFDDDGNVYAAYGVTVSTGSGAQTTLVVATSTDGGASYTQFAQLATNVDIGVPGNDKWHLAAGPDPANPAQSNVYIAWTQNVKEGSNTDQRIVVSASTDSGATFSAPVVINDASVSGSQTGNLFADPAVGPNGELYVAWHDIGAGEIWFDSSTDAGSTWGTDSMITSSSTGFKTSIPAQPDRGVHVGPNLDTDRTGTNPGRIYLNYTDTGGGGLPDTDILVRYSDDGGASWSGSVLVNDDGGTNSQFLPWLDVDQDTGLVTAAWYDARNDTDNKEVEIYMAVSADGGNTFQANILVSDAASDMSTDNASRYTGNFLEYIGIATYDCVAVPVWADNSESGGDLDYYVDRVLIHEPGICNFPPKADAGGPYFTNEGVNAPLDGSGSTDSDGDPLTYEWDFDANGVFDDATGVAPEFDLVGQDGVYSIALRVTDPEGEFDEDVTTVTVSNVAPSVSLGSDSPKEEGSPLTVNGVVTDPGWLDILAATIDWGDGSPGEAVTQVLENNRPDATLTFSVSHTYGDNGDFSVEVCGYDDDTSTCESIVVTITNVPPEVTIDPSQVTEIDEGDLVDVLATFVDPGWLDTFTAEVDWGTPTFPPEPGTVTITKTGPPDVQGEVTASKQYGDNGVFEITVTVTDDDGGSGSDAFDLTVLNVDPTAEIDKTDTFLINGIPAFIAHAGDPIDFEGRSTDPGSDDLYLGWDWDDGPPAPDVTTEYLVNPPLLDPFPSPSVQPRDVTDMKTHAFDLACLYEIGFMADDDDGGHGDDSAVVVIVGNADKNRSEGYWQHQFSRKGNTDFEDAELECYLEIIGFVSAVFNEERDASTIPAAHDVLLLKKNAGSEAEQLDRELLRVWLNFANGSIEYDQMFDTDKDGVLDASFAEIVVAAEAVRLDPGATVKELREQTRIVHLLNNR